MIVNLYKLYFLFSHYSFQPITFFHPSNQTHDRKNQILFIKKKKNQKQKSVVLSLDCLSLGVL